MEGGLGASIAIISRCFSSIIRWFVAILSLIAITPPFKVTLRGCRRLVYSVISALGRGLIKLLGKLLVVLFIL